MFRRLTPLRRQQGSMLILGIFVLTVMFALAAALINISRRGHDAINQEVLGARALFAAGSGADAALARLFPAAGGSGTCAPSDTWPVPANAVSIRECQVTRTCKSFTFNNEIQYRVTSRAVCRAGSIRVSRGVEVIARDN